MSGVSKKPYLAAGGGISAAFASMLCCTGPLVLAAVGVSGAGLASIAPFRPVFVILAFVALWAGFQALERQERAGDEACETDEPCASPEARRRMRTILWLATALTVVFTTSALWDDLFF
jgi:mercuric ion transport protein